MRTDEERMEQIRRRTKKLRERDRKRKLMVLDVCCVAVCLVIILGIGAVMPGMSEQMQYRNVSGLTSGAASILGNSSSAGYIVIGILGFLLGVCITILMYRVHMRNKEKKSDEL